MKSWQKTLFILCVLIILVVGGGLVALKVLFPVEKIRNTITTEASKALGREVTVSEIGISIWPFGLSIEQLGIAAAKDSSFAQTPLVEIGQVVLKVNLAALFTGSLAVDEVSVSRLRAYLEIAPDGRLSIADLIKGEEETPKAKTKIELPTLPIEIALNKLELVQWEVEVKDRKMGRTIKLGQLDQSMNLFVNQDLSNITSAGLLTLKQISIEDKGLGIRKGAISVSVDHDIVADLKKGQLTLNKMHINALGMDFDLTGTVNNILDTMPSFDMKFESALIEMSNVLKEIPKEINPHVAMISAGGAWKLGVEAKGLVTDPKVKGQLELKNLSFAHSQSPAKIEQINGSILFSPESLVIPDLSLLAGKNPINVKVKLIELLTKPYLAQLAVDGSIDLANILPIADALGVLPDSLTAVGVISFDVKGSGPIDPANPLLLDISGESNMNLTKVKLPGIAPVITAQGLTTFNKNMLTSGVKSTVGSSDFTTKVVVRDFLALALPDIYLGKRTRVDLEVRSQNLSLDEIMPPANSEEQAPSELPEAFPALPPVDVYVDVQLKQTLFKHLKLSDLVLKSRVLDNQLTSQMRANLYGGSISQNLKSDLSKPTDAKFDFDMTTSKVEFNDLFVNGRKNLVGESKLFQILPKLDNTIFGKSDLVMSFNTFGSPRTLAQNLTGTINSKVYKGKIAETELIKGYNSAVGSFSSFASNLAVKDLSFDKFLSEIDVEDGNFIVKHLELEQTPLGFLNVQGKISFEGNLDLTLTNHLPQSVSKQILSAQSGVTNSAAKATGLGFLKSMSAVPTTPAGEVKVYYSVGGTLTNPSFGLETDRMQAEGTSGAQDALAKEKAKLEAEAKAKIAAEKKKLEDRAMAEKKKVEEKAKKEVKKQTDKVKSKATDEAKKALKKFGF